MKNTEGPSVLPLIQGIPNSTTRPRLGDKAHLNDLHPSSVLEPRNMNLIHSQKIIRGNSIIKAVDHIHEDVRQIHKDVSKSRTSKREGDVRRNNELTNIQPVDLDIGDIVFVADLQATRSNKLRVK